MISGVIQKAQAQRPSAEQDPRLDWWRAAKFGLFIHWGLYAIPPIAPDPINTVIVLTG